MRGPREHNDPPGYQSRAAATLMKRRPAGPSAEGMGYERLQELNAIIVGSPETVAKKLRNTVERLSPGYLILIGSDGSIPHKDIMRSIDLFGREVIPALHEVKLQPYE
jgi:alkanesulfonate monooxygenase SsuD/methylene tetrahydromethanopterin reductase-like flavin-dependent oxidoreductase (luciferase family)